MKESEWSNDAKQRPDPSLFSINIGEQKQIQITHPPKDFGDYNPTYLPVAGKLTWLRKRDLAELRRDLWIADQYGENAKVWIKNIGQYDFFEEKH
ncbi:hypothetical protein [Neobacillus sp. NPDC093127]|uniref:hypothetical protein n=1 Tax=Neobacillus sp. NPDC093127 TaxID=3364296 RepID=UPI0038294150